MPTFTERLAANPGGSGIYGNPGQQTQGSGDALDIVNLLKDREMRDFKEKANFMSDLSLKQDRQRALYDPSNEQGNQQQNTRVAQDPNQMTGYEKGELGVRQQGLNLEQQKIAQTGKLGEEALGVKTAQEKLNQQKSDQINVQKQADMQRKIDDSTQKFAAMQAELERKTKAGEDTLQLHKDIAASAEERHKLEMEKMKHDMDIKDQQFEELKKQHSDLLTQRGRTKTTIKQGDETRTTTIERGDAADTVQAVGKDGKTYTIPKDKLDDQDADGTPHWKPAGGE